MKIGTVRYEVDLAHLPPLTSAQQAEIKALGAMPSSEINTSDIPPLPDTFWQNAIRNPFYRSVGRRGTGNIG